MPGILKYIIYIIAAVVLSLNVSCRQKLPQHTESDRNVALSPDYTSISIPPNIAPLNFRIKETANSYLVRFYNSNGTDFIIRSKTGNIQIPVKKWRKLLSDAKEYSVDVFTSESQKWSKFNTITNYITSDPIDNYLTYRLIEPGFVGWNKMGIYQRDLETFNETPIILNGLSDGSCVNCHTFNGNSNKTMMFHVRGKNGGTIVYRNNTLSKINTTTDNTISQESIPPGIPRGITLPVL